MIAISRFVFGVTARNANASRGYAGSPPCR